MGGMGARALGALRDARTIIPPRLGLLSQVEGEKEIPSRAPRARRIYARNI